MKVLVFSDIHSDARALTKLVATAADYYFCAGDLVNWGRHLEAMGEILKPLGERLYVIPGNHETEGQVAELCVKYGFQNFHGGHVELDGFHFTGLGYSNPTPFDTPGEYSEAQLEEKLHAFDGLKPMVSICHTPPWGTSLDRITNLKHAGSRAVRDFLVRERPRYFFCGHIHEAGGVAEKLGETSAMNVGKKGYLLDLDEQRELGLL